MPLIYLYSHDGEGLGHFRRNLNIATAATHKLPQLSALLLTGSLYPSLFELPERCDYVKIPALQKAGADSYGSRLGPDQQDTTRNIRKQLLLEVVRTAPPNLLIVDKHPGGLYGELLPVLEWLRLNSPETRIIFGMRDVLDDPEHLGSEWQQAGNYEILSEYYHHIWCYGDKNIYDGVNALGLSAELRDKVKWCGYVAPKVPLPSTHSETSRTIVATVGGGHDGFPVLNATIEAFLKLRPHHRRLMLRMFTGPLMPRADYRRLKDRLIGIGPHVRVERFSPRMLRYLASADVIITMGGYNSIIEAVTSGNPVIAIPREDPRREQLIRARAFREAGMLKLVRIEELKTDKLQLKLEAALQREWAPEPNNKLNIGGLEKIQAEIKHMLEAPVGEAEYSVT